MITSREFLDVCEFRGVDITYTDLRVAMRDLGIWFRSRKVAGFNLVCYLDGNACRQLLAAFGVPQ